MITGFFKDYIEANLSLTFGTDLFIGLEPDTPDEIVVLTNETGFRESWQNEYGSDWLGLMVRVRGYQPSAEKTMFDIHNLITNYGRVENADFKLITTFTQGEPAQIEIDDKGRAIMTAHYIAHVNYKNKTTNRQNIG